MSGANDKQSLPTYLKLSLLIVATAFLAYSIYWAINGVTWAYSITQLLLRAASGQTIPITTWGTPHLTLLFIQEYASVVNCYLQLACGAFAFYSAVLYLKKDPRYLGKLRVAIIFLALFLFTANSSQHPSPSRHRTGLAHGQRLRWALLSVAGTADCGAAVDFEPKNEETTKTLRRS